MGYRVSFLAIPVALAAGLVLALMPLAPAGNDTRDAQGQSVPTVSFLGQELRAGVAAARIIVGIISPEFESLDLRGNSRIINVTGPIECTAGEMFRIEVGISQESTLAGGEGQTQGHCTGEVQTWTVRVVARGPAGFAPGPVNACGVATTRSGGTLTDTFQWCKEKVLE